MPQKSSQRPLEAQKWQFRGNSSRNYRHSYSSDQPPRFTLANRQVGLLLVGSVLLALGVGSGIRLMTATPKATAPSEFTPAASNTGTTAFESGPFVPSSGGLRLANPSLLQSTPKEVRLDTVVAGRPDPFAPVAQPTGGASARRPAEPLATASTPPAPPQLPVIPVTVTQALPPLPTAVPPLPELGPVAALPTPGGFSGTPQGGLPQSLVDRIEISGVVHIGSRVSVIVKEPGATTSRYVSTGDAIANGQVRIKRIDLSDTEPTVVLEYNGQEFYRSVGSTALVGLL